MKRARSPLGHVGRKNLVHLRALVGAYIRWERTLGTPDQALSPTIPHAVRAALPMAVEDRARQKSLLRISRRQDAEAVNASLRGQRQRVHGIQPAYVDPLARIADELTTIRRLLEDGATPEVPPRMGEETDSR